MIPTIGLWYHAHYGLETVVGKCIGYSNGHAVLSFRWCYPWRTHHPVPITSLLCESPDPRWLGPLFNILGIP